MNQVQSFHDSIDRNVRAFQNYKPGSGWGKGVSHITFRDRSVKYLFFPHFHPYVAANRALVAGMKLSLMERLKENGLAGLEDSDTLYMPQPNTASGLPLTIIRGSTRGPLTATLSATRVTDGAVLSLTAGTPITLPDATVVSVPNGTTVVGTDGTTSVLAADTNLPLPGKLPVSSSTG